MHGWAKSMLLEFFDAYTIETHKYNTKRIETDIDICP